MVDRLIERSASDAAKLKDQSARISLEVEFQFVHKGPLFYILRSAHEKAVQAFLALSTVDPTAVEEIRKLQNTIELYSTTGNWLKVALDAGREAFANLDDEVSEEIVRTLISGEEA